MVTPAQRHLGQVARGGVLGLLGAVVSAASGILLVVVVTRGLPPHEAGLFFSATAAFLILSALVSLGTDAGLGRFVLRLEAEGRQRDVGRVIGSAVRGALSLSVVVGAALVVLADPVARLLGWQGAEHLLPVLFALALPLTVLSDVALSATRAFGRIGPTVVIDRFVRAGGQALLAVLVVVLGGRLEALTGTWLAAYAVAAVLAVAALSSVRRERSGTVLPRQDAAVAGFSPRAVVREFWHFTWPRGLTRLAQVGIQKADIVLVAVLVSPGAAAVYTAATRFVALGQFATQALQQALQPRFTAILVHEDRATLREVHRVATAWNVLLSWPVYLVIGCAPAAYLGVFGGRYAADPAARTVVVLMMLAMLAAVASGPVDTLLLMAGRSGRSLLNAACALLVDLGLCLVLVPRWGIRGAAIAWALAVLTRCGLAYRQVRAELRVVPAGRAFFTAVATCVGVVGAPVLLATLLGLQDPRWWGLLVLGLAVPYLLLLRAQRGVLRLDLLVVALRRGPGVVGGAAETCRPPQRPSASALTTAAEEPCIQGR